MSARGALVVLLVLVVGGAAFAGRENLLKNPGAEEGETGWRPFYLERGDARVWVADGVARAGKKALGITSRSRCFAMWQQFVPVEAGRVYEFSAHLRLEDVEGRAVLHVRFPFPAESEFVAYDAKDSVYWTNRPGAVVRTWVGEETNPPVKAVQRFFHMEFDVAKVLGSQVVRAAGP